MAPSNNPHLSSTDDLAAEQFAELQQHLAMYLERMADDNTWSPRGPFSFFHDCLLYEDPTAVELTQLTDPDQVQMKMDGFSLGIAQHLSDIFGEWLNELEAYFPGFTDRFLEFARAQVSSVVMMDSALSDPSFVLKHVQTQAKWALDHIMNESSRDIFDQKWGHLEIYSAASFKRFRDIAIKSSVRLQQRLSRDTKVELSDGGGEDLTREAVTVEDRGSELFRDMQVHSQGFIDLDSFKKVNDKYGQLAGDAVLEQVFARIKSSVHDNDLVSAYGGEEIVVFMPHTPHEGAMEAMEKVRRSIDDMTIRIPKKLVKGAEQDILLKVTVSIGVDSITLDDYGFSKDDTLAESWDASVERRQEAGERLDVNTERATKAAKVMPHGSDGRLKVEVDAKGVVRSGAGSKKNCVVSFAEDVSRYPGAIELLDHMIDEDKNKPR